MPLHFAVSIRFLDPRFHGRGDGGISEWPPSPLRVFQALVAAAAARSRKEGLRAEAQSALRWLEQLSEKRPPLIMAPAAKRALLGYRLSVPNNAMDIVANAWARGNDSNSGDADPRTHRAMKTIQPTHFISGDTVHFLWPLLGEATREEQGHIEVLITLARNVVALGWGVDLVVGSAAMLSEQQVGEVQGQQWLPSARNRDGLRVPVAGTLDALIDRHSHFLGRLTSDGAFSAPPPLTVFKVIGYSRSDEPAERPVAAFRLRDPDGDRPRSFDTVRQGLTVAGRMRHATYEAAKSSKAGDWSESQLAAFVLGHAESKGAGHLPVVGGRRFAYLPLPTIEFRGAGKQSVGAIRRLLVSAFADDCEEEIAWAHRALAGQLLIDERSKRATAILESIPSDDEMVKRYSARAESWATVTPVVLPGYDDPRHYRRRLAKNPPAEEQKQLLGRLSERIEKLIRTAIVQAGFSRVLAEHAVVDWGKVGFWAGSDLADHYGVPNHLQRFPRYHVRIDWRDAADCPISVPGPICIGGGRFMGVGLFAPLESSR